MKTLVVVAVVLMLVILAASVQAVVVLKGKDGTTLTWDNLLEEDGNYCTWKSAGKFCIPKGDIASVKEEKEEVIADNVTVKYSSEGNNSVSSNQSSPAKFIDALDSYAKECWRMYGHNGQGRACVANSPVFAEERRRIAEQTRQSNIENDRKNRERNKW